MRTSNRYWPFTLDANWEAVNGILSQDFRNAVLTVIAGSSANLTFKVYASTQENKPDFTDTASASNEYSPTLVVDLDTWTNIQGSVWITYWGSDDWIYKYEINQNANRWIWCKITAYTAWTITVYVDLYDNQ